MSQSSTAGIDTLLEIIDAEDTEPPPAAAEHPTPAAERPPAAAEPPPAAARARKLPAFARATEMGTHGAQSRERWKATRTQRVDAQLLHLFSGPSDKHGDPRSLAHQVEYKGSERGLHLRVDEYDWVHCHCSSGSGSNRALCHPAPHEPWRTRCFNLLRGEVFDELLAYCHQGQYAAVVAGIPCHTFCVARFREDNGAKALRDKQHPFGLPHLSDSAGSSGYGAKSGTAGTAGTAVDDLDEKEEENVKLTEHRSAMDRLSRSKGPADPRIGKLARGWHREDYFECQVCSTVISLTGKDRSGPHTYTHRCSFAPSMLPYCSAAAVCRARSASSHMSSSRRCAWATC